MQDKDKTKSELIAELEELRNALEQNNSPVAGNKKTRILELQEHFSNVLNNTGIGISLISRKMEILSLNNQMKEWFPDIDVDSHPYCFMSFNNPPLNKPCPHCPTKKTFKDGLSHEEITETLVNGKLLNYSIISSPIKDENGDIIAVIEVVNDITNEKKAKAELKASEEKYKILFENIRSGVAIYDVVGDGEDFIFKDFNKAGEIIDNDKSENLIGKSIFEVRPGVKEFGLTDVLKRVWKTGTPESFPIKEYKDDRLSGWYENYIYKLPSGEVVAVFENITEKKIAEETLKENEERFRKIFDQNNFGMGMSDKNFNFFRVNDAFCNMFEYSSEELLKLTFKDLTHPDYLEKDIENIKKLAEGKIKSYKTVKRYITKTGRIIWGKINLSILHDVNRNFLHYLIIIEDITEIKQAEESLKISEERFHRLIKSVTDYIYTVKIENGKETSTLHSPGCFNVTGYTTEEFEKDNELWYRIIYEEDKEHVTKKLQNILKENESNSFFEHRIIHRNGSIRWIRNTPVIQKDSDGKVIAYDGLISDITERKMAEEKIIALNKELEKHVEERTAELETSNKELEAFSYSVSHDLKSPLRIIMGFSQLLLEEYGTDIDKQMRGYLEKINVSIKRMSTLIDDLLNLSRITKTDMYKTVFDLCNMSKSIIMDMQNQFPDRDVKFICPEKININADPNLIKIAIRNLLENSWKYTSKKQNIAKIELGIIKQKDNPIYFVKDNGVGFDMTYANKLFIPFQRLHTAGEYEGTGIGLAIVNRIISKHGGQVWIESKEGKGTTVFFTL